MKASNYIGTSLQLDSSEFDDSGDKLQVSKLRPFQFQSLSECRIDRPWIAHAALEPPNPMNLGIFSPPTQQKNPSPIKIDKLGMSL